MAQRQYTRAELEAIGRQAAARYHIPAALVLAIMEAESGFRAYVTSSAGALGPMQLMPGTARSLGVDPRDPAQNIDGGAKYLSQLSRRFNGDMDRTIAAYNAGPGAVERYHGIPPYAETRTYVQRVKSFFARNTGHQGGGQPTRPKWSPLIAELEADAAAQGMKVSSGDRDHDTVAGPGVSDHTRSKTNTWARDFVPVAAMSQAQKIQKCKQYEAHVKQRFSGRYKQVLGPSSDPRGHGGSNAHVHVAGWSEGAGSGGASPVGLHLPNLGVPDQLQQIPGALQSIPGAIQQFGRDLQAGIREAGWQLVEGAVVVGLVVGGMGLIVVGAMRATGTESVATAAVTKGVA